MKTSKSARRRLARGFTILEVLIGVVVLSIGMIGILGMQTVAVVTNRVSYDARVATELAEMTLEQCKRDAQSWVTVGGWPVGSWLDRAMSVPGNWVTPPPTTGAVAPIFNDLAVQRGTTDGPISERNSRFCIRYRASQVGAANLARLEVDTAWPRNRAGEGVLGTGGCAGVLAALEGAGGTNFLTVRVTGIVTQNASLASE